MIRAVIVDDMPLARERVRLYLEGEPDIAILGEASNGADALCLIKREAPDLAFLDIRLPDFDGLEVLGRLAPERRPATIYLTAHEDHAVAAFDIDAVDYLLKPFSRDRFARAIARARERIAPRAEPTRIAVKDRGRIDLVPIGDIDYVDSARHYACLHVGRQVHLMRISLGELEAQLDPARFARIHRCMIVQLARVETVASRRNGDLSLTLRGGATLTVSRTYAEDFRARLGLVAG
ncbi:MAG: LytR/AlgR family response regulator transcription factor [Steroidobacteraceae bacterium]